MDKSELAGLSAEELIAKRDTIEEEIRKQHELLDMVRTCRRHASRSGTWPVTDHSVPGHII